MALLTMIFRKIFRNFRLISCLLFGLIISTALISSIPIYTEGTLQRLLIKELEDYQEKEGKYTGLYRVYCYANEDDIRDELLDSRKSGIGAIKKESVLKYLDERYNTYMSLDTYIKGEVAKLIGLPVQAAVSSYATDVRRVETEDSEGNRFDRMKYAKIVSMSGVKDHISIIDGRRPETTPTGGVYEVLASEWALKKLDIVIGKVYTLYDPGDYGFEPIKVRPAGVFTVNESSDPYWYGNNPETVFGDSFLMDEGLMKKEFLDRKPSLIYSAQWNFVFDYHAVKAGALKSVAWGLGTAERNLTGMYKTISISSPFKDVMIRYFERETRLKNILLVLYVPVIIMLFLYLFMLSRLIIERESNEISLLSSRGANRLQIVSGYFIQWAVLCIIAFAAGPAVGLLISRVLGASNGFLEFTRRKALELFIGKNAFLYAAAASCVSLVTMLIPAYTASGISIVNYKQTKAGKPGKALWERIYLDIAMLAVSAYGFRTFARRQEIMHVTSASSLDIQIDPMLFLVPSCFIIGAALLFLRLYPLLVKGVYWAGKRFWPPSFYVTLIQVGRMFKSYHFLTVFMVMTLSTGIFSATAARTINLNEEEKVRYKSGADMVLLPMWENDSQMTGDADAGAEKRVNYLEPSFTPYTELDGVSNAAKVFRKDKAYVDFNGKQSEISLMGIEPYDFGQVAWMRSRLLPLHFNEYLNLLTGESSACLISKSISDKYGLKVGDSIQAGWRNRESAIFTVYGIINYWPSWNPNKDPNRKNDTEPMLIVANLPYIQDHLGTEPYEVWLKMKPGAASSQVYKSIESKSLRVADLTDTSRQLIQVRRSPFLLALNGVLTMGFIISGIICFLGFLIYWILSINSRVLQFGVFRAVGFSAGKLVSMIALEQVLTSGASIFAGVFTGLVSSRIFVPFFQMAFDSYSQVPPFRVVSYSDDRLKVYVLVGFTLILGLAVLGRMISRIKIDKAIKLGEE